MSIDHSIVPIEGISSVILTLRGQKAILDADLARLYGVETKVFNQAVKRNMGRFPPDFMFQLTRQEINSLRSQIVTSNEGRGGRRYLPYAFTEHGAVMAATILNSPHAVDVSVYVVRAFVRLREILALHSEFADRLEEIERQLDGHSSRPDGQDEHIQMIMDAVQALLALPEPSERRIGFRTEPEKE